MALTLLLDEYTLPESGVVDLRLIRSFEIKVTADAARRQVKHWLFDEVSMMLTAQTPTLLLGTRVVWRVPVIFTTAHIGPVGCAGEVDVDVATGAMNNTAANKEMILDQSRKLAANMPPYQPRTTTPQGWVAKNFQPTHPAGQPAGNPLDLLPTANRDLLRLLCHLFVTFSDQICDRQTDGGRN